MSPFYPTRPAQYQPGDIVSDRLAGDHGVIRSVRAFADGGVAVTVFIFGRSVVREFRIPTGGSTELPIIAKANGSVSLQPPPDPRSAARKHAEIQEVERWSWEHPATVDAVPKPQGTQRFTRQWLERQTGNPYAAISPAQQAASLEGMADRWAGTSAFLRPSRFETTGRYSGITAFDHWHRRFVLNPGEPHWRPEPKKQGKTNSFDEESRGIAIIDLPALPGGRSILDGTANQTVFGAAATAQRRTFLEAQAAHAFNQDAKVRFAGQNPVLDLIEATLTRRNLQHPRQIIRFLAGRQDNFSALSNIVEDVYEDLERPSGHSGISPIVVSSIWLSRIAAAIGTS